MSATNLVLQAMPTSFQMHFLCIWIIETTFTQLAMEADDFAFIVSDLERSSTYYTQDLNVFFFSKCRLGLPHAQVCFNLLPQHSHDRQAGRHSAVQPGRMWTENLKLQSWGLQYLMRALQAQKFPLWPPLLSLPSSLWYVIYFHLHTRNNNSFNHRPFTVLLLNLGLNSPK